MSPRLLTRRRSPSARRRRLARASTAAAVALLLGCSSNPDRLDDSAAAHTPVPDSIVASDNARAATTADSTAVESTRIRLDAEDARLHTPNAFTPLEGTRLAVRRDARQNVIAALALPERPDSTSAARALYVFDDDGMTAGFERTFRDSSAACAGRVQARQRWMLRDGRIVGYERTLTGDTERRVSKPRCAVPAGDRVVIYTSWPTLANASMSAAP